METPQSDNPFVQDVALILRDFLRTIKAVCMYPENNSLPQSLRQAFSSRLLDAVEEHGQIRLSVDKAAILLNGEIVHRDKSREDNLADLFFTAGITEFAFRMGLTPDSINKLLSAIRTYVNAPLGEQDLPALLWESGVVGFDFQTAEDVALSEYDANFRIQEYFREEDEKRLSESGGIGTVENYEAIFLTEAQLEPPQPPPTTVDGTLAPSAVFEVDRDEAERLKAQAAAEAMGLANLPVTPPPDAGLILQNEIKLSEEERHRMQQLLDDDDAFDMYESTSQMLIELLLQETTLKGFSESAITCEKMLSEFIRLGKVAQAGFLLESLRRLAGQIRSQKPRWSETLEDILVTAGSRERLQLLAAALNEHESISIGELRQYLEVFDWQALSGITDLLGDLEYRHHRESVCAYLVDRGRGKEEILARGIYDKRWYVVRNSVMILGHIGDDRALQHLKHTMNHEDRRVRIELVWAIRHNPNPKALEILRHMVYDTDEEIHQEALKAIMTYSGPVAFQTIAEVVCSISFTDLDPKEQLALLIGYSQLGKEQAVAYLEGLITRYNPTRNPVHSFFRTAAFEALEHNPSEKAHKLLKQLAGSWRPDLKRRALAALQHRRQTLGGDQ